jgi:hypothetical protein
MAVAGRHGEQDSNMGNLDYRQSFVGRRGGSDAFHGKQHDGRVFLPVLRPADHDHAFLLRTVRDERVRAIKVKTRSRQHKKMTIIITGIICFILGFALSYAIAIAEYEDMKLHQAPWKK